MKDIINITNVYQTNFLVYSYLYYVKDVSLITDNFYDSLCKRLYEFMKYDCAVETEYYNLCKELDLSCSGFYLKEHNYPFEIQKIAYKLQRQAEEKREIKMDELDEEIKNKFKLIIAGGRDFDNYDLMKEKLDKMLQNKNIDDIFFISGTASGADTLGERYAKEIGAKICNIWRFPANWDIGKQAGYIRNYEMSKFGDALVAFWDGKSKGTSNMIDIAKKNDLQVRVIKYG